MNPEIRVTSPTTVAGDSPRGSPALEQMVKKRSIEGDRRERRERREKKERERRERMAREEGGRI